MSDLSVCLRVMWDGHSWWALREVKTGREPGVPDFQPVAHNPDTGVTIGWEPAHRHDRWLHLVHVAEQLGWQAGVYNLLTADRDEGHHDGSPHVLQLVDDADDAAADRLLGELLSDRVAN